MAWGKIVNGELFTADNVLITDTEQIFNAPAELWLEHGCIVTGKQIGRAHV